MASEDELRRLKKRRDELYEKEMECWRATELAPLPRKAFKGLQAEYYGYQRRKIESQIEQLEKEKRRKSPPPK
jgi:hypothetical protein